MPGIPAKSGHAEAAARLVSSLQRRLVERLESVANERFEPIEWLRDEGRHGGGTRLVAPTQATFDRASVNVSAIHYDDMPEKRLGSATALSAIVHPANPLVSSVHTHFSWTELRDGRGYWRMMADLNPSVPVVADRERFVAALREAAGEHFEGAAAEGDRYFHIPALERHRGVAHFYLEGFTTGEWDADAALARRIARAVIDTYGGLLAEAVQRTPTAEHAEAQRRYHTVYLFQVLTRDRGTTSGLLVHDQNDVGILGSLPSRVDRELLASWAGRVEPVQVPLVKGLVAALGADGRVDTEAKRRLARTVREHCRAHPEALALQARGALLPPTVANHR